ncbi:hypothetical protein [Herbidospora mongoliensis]|uniref:hypothetical protein n=1 Tax=Herbidospora mongoliensis TaxID=688067 RepID=UPI000832EBB2|nr:hypothetical protein [Herbidospora mongoliensis]
MYRRALAIAASAVLAFTLIPSVAEAAAPNVEIVPGHTSTLGEKNSRFFCPANEVITGRAHQKDENGPTTYWCGKIVIDGEQVSVSTYHYVDAQTEPFSWFEAPEANAMVGREHRGDENGVTTTYFALLTWRGQPVKLVNRRWTGALRESRHESRASGDEIMTGRRHHDDENGDSFYQYATVTF